MLYLLRHFYYCACRIECFYLISRLLSARPRTLFQRILITQRSGSIEYSWVIECEEIPRSLCTHKISALHSWQMEFCQQDTSLVCSLCGLAKKAGLYKLSESLSRLYMFAISTTAGANLQPLS
jgi:hypothetical protein